VALGKINIVEPPV